MACAIQPSYTHKIDTEEMVVQPDSRLSAGVAVEGKVVLGAGGNTADLALERKALDAGRESSGGGLALETQEVGGETSDVRGSHGSTRYGVLYLVSL